MIDHTTLVKLNSDDIPNVALIADPAFRFQWVDLTSGNRITKEDASIGLGDNSTDTSSTKRNGSMLTGGATAKIGTSKDNCVVGIGLSRINEGNWIGGGGEAREGKGP